MHITNNKRYHCYCKRCKCGGITNKPPKKCQECKQNDKWTINEILAKDFFKLKRSNTK